MNGNPPPATLFIKSENLHKKNFPELVNGNCFTTFERVILIEDEKKSFLFAFYSVFVELFKATTTIG